MQRTVFVFQKRTSSLRIQLGRDGSLPWSLLCKTASIPFCPSVGSPLSVKVLTDAVTVSVNCERTRVYRFLVRSIFMQYLKRCTPRSTESFEIFMYRAVESLFPEFALFALFATFEERIAFPLTFEVKNISLGKELLARFSRARVSYTNCRQIKIIRAVLSFWSILLGLFDSLK